MAVNKVVYGTTVLVDLTGDTVTADKLMQGYTAHNRSGALITGIATGGGGDTYTLTTVVPQQTFTPQEISGSYQTTVTYTSGLEDGEGYLVTFDGEQYVCECGVYWGTEYLAGYADLFWGSRAESPYPFSIGYSPSVPEFSVGTYDLNQHTIKVEHLEFVDGPLNLIAKSVTANGTYSASSDNADGYSSVTVNVSGGGSVEFPTFSATVDEETGEITSVTCDKTYAECQALIEDGNELAHMVVTGSGYSVPCFGFVGVTAIVYDVVDPSSSELIGSISYYISGIIEFEQASSSSMNVQTAQSMTRVANTAYTKTASLTCAVSGTYDVYWDCFRSTTSSTYGSQLYIGGTASGSANTMFSNHAQNNHRTGVQINANQEVAVYVRSRSTTNYAYCGQLTIVQTA